MREWAPYGEVRVMTKTLFVFVLAAVLTSWAQITPAASDAQQSVPPQNSNQVEPLPQTPTYQVNVVERTTAAVDYRYRGGTTEVSFRGTDLMPAVDGKAKIEGKVGRLSLSVDVHHLRQARDLGMPYLTYVLWAITPEGRPVNLGELIPDDDGHAKLGVTTSLSSFGLIVTAEPYFAVTRPSTEMVAENIVPQDVKGFIRPITAKFDLMDRGQYMISLNPDQLPAANPADRNVPLQLLEARDAVAIARASGADNYAADTLAKAVDMLYRAEDYYRRKQGTTPIGTAARSATQSAEDARLLTINKKEEERASAARQQLQERIEHAQTEAEANAERAELARKQAADETAQRQRAEEEREAAERAAKEAENARLAAEQAAQQSQQQLAAAQQQQQALQQQQQQLQQEAAEARQQAQAANQAREQVERQAAEQRQRLVQQLNTVLQTKDTARGVVAQMSDVLFAINKATLKPEAKIRLAKVAGIVMAYPDLKLEIDGYTDSTGSAQRNELLSQERAATVRDFLISQGVPLDNVTARGLGEENPIASNATAAGRRLNRRVELVLNGTAIGQNAGASMPTAPAGSPPAGPQPGSVATPTSPPPH